MKKNMWFWVVLVAGGHFWVDFYANMLPPLLPFLAVLWGLNNAQLAFIISLQSITSHFLQPVFGYLMDKKPSQWFLGQGFLLLAIPMSIISFIGKYEYFLIIVAFAGVGTALYHPLGATRVVYGPDEDKGLKMSIYSCFGSVGYALAPVVIASIVMAYGLGSLAYTFIPGFIWVAVLSFYEKQKVNNYQPKLLHESVGKIPRPVYKQLLRLSCIVALRTWLQTAAVIFVPLLLVAQGISEKGAGLNLTLFLAAGTMGGIVCGVIYHKVGAKKMLITTLAMALLLMPLYLCLQGPFRILALLAFGFVLMGSAPVTIVLGQQMMPLRAGLASGITMGLAFGLGGLGIMVTGFLADQWGTQTALLVTAFVLIPAIILTLSLDVSVAAKIKEEEKPL